MNFKSEIRFNVKDAAGEDLILPKDVLARSVEAYRRAILATSHIVYDVDLRDDIVIAMIRTMDNESGRKLAQALKANAATVEVKGSVRESGTDETGFPIVKSFEIHSVSIRPG